MIISDLSFLEVTVDNKEIQGGIIGLGAFADADAFAEAFGKLFSGTKTETFTVVKSSKYGNYSASGSSSSAGAV